MLKKDLEFHIIFEMDEKELFVHDILADEDELQTVAFEGVESVDTLMQSLRALIETINEH